MNKTIKISVTPNLFLSFCDPATFLIFLPLKCVSSLASLSLSFFPRRNHKPAAINLPANCCVLGPCLLIPDTDTPFTCQEEEELKCKNGKKEVKESKWRGGSLRNTKKGGGVLEVKNGVNDDRIKVSEGEGRRRR